MAHKNPTLSAPSQQADPRSKFRLYYQLNRLHLFPIGTDLMFWPCGWGLAMAYYHTSRPFTGFLADFVLYAIGMTILHCAACVLNDICDRKLDAQERTKHRPLACGAISLNGAVTCLAIEVSILIVMLSATRNTLALLAGLIGIFPLHGLYPLTKRRTNWPQAWLGVTGGCGFVVAWAHRVPVDTTHTVPAIFVLTFTCWTLVFDTIYACQDREDDIKAGSKSTAVLFGDYLRPIISVFACAFVCGMAYLGMLNQHGTWYYLLSVGGPALHFLWQIGTLQPSNPADCWSKFKANGRLGYLVLTGMLMDNFMKA